MHCNKARKMISKYLDSELNSRDEGQLLLHINSCAQCREEMQFFSEMLKDIPTSETIEPAPGFLSAIKEKIKSADRHPAQLPWFWKLSPAMAGLFSLAILIPFLAGMSLGNAYLAKSISPVRDIFSALGLENSGDFVFDLPDDFF